MRTQSISHQLRRAGVISIERAQRWLEHSQLKTLSENPKFWVDLGRAADPDQVLLALLNYAESGTHEKLFAQLATDDLLRRQLFIVIGASRFFADYLQAKPELVEVLANPADTCIFTDDYGYHVQLEDESVESFRQAVRGDFLKRIRAEEIRPDVWVVQPSSKSLTDLLRALYRRVLLRIFADDLMHPNPLGYLSVVGKKLAALTDATLEAALAIARGQTTNANLVDFSIVALGKTGACELNYISDIDVIYTASAADNGTQSSDLTENQVIEIATALATRVANICSDPGGDEAPLWPIDTALRPEGKDGALVRTVASHLEYYQKWAQNWEFQALLKARHAAGNRVLTMQYLQGVNPLVWSAVEREDFIQNAQEMRTRVEQNIAVNQAGDNLKLGVGGLRDIEFSVQLLQLVHGRTDLALRVKPTLQALSVLAAEGYISRESANELANFYRFLRLLEHRLQTRRMQRTHLLPTTETQWRILSRSIGKGNDSTALQQQCRTVRSQVRKLQQDIFYRPLLPVTAQLSKEVVDLSKDAAMERLRAVGYLDPAGAIRHIQALTSGISRRATIARHLLPVLLQWFAEGPNPDKGLFYFRVLSEKIGSSHWYMKLLRDSASAAQYLCWVLSTSPYIARRLEHVPEAVKWLDSKESLIARTERQLDEEIEALSARHQSFSSLILRLREMRARELLRAALADAVWNLDARHSQRQISQINDAVIRGATKALRREMQLPEEFEIAVVAMGRGGGSESSYNSDGDLMVVYTAEMIENAAQTAIDFAIKLRDSLSNPGSAPEYKIDYDLRPEGRDGALARSLDSYREYYEHWASTWEKQALLRARVVSGSQTLSQRFIKIIDEIRYPASITDSDIREIRRLKARMEQERIQRGKDRNLEVKLGPGGLSDVEWTVQLLQLRFARGYPQLRQTGTLAALQEAVSVGLISEEDAQILEDAWILASRIRSGNVLISDRSGGKKIDFLPVPITEQKTLARLLGYNPGSEKDLEEDYRRFARRCRAVTNRIFYGIAEEEKRI